MVFWTKIKKLVRDQIIGLHYTNTDEISSEDFCASKLRAKLDEFLF